MEIQSKKIVHTKYCRRAFFGSVEYIFRWVLKAAADEGYLDTEAIFVDGTHIKAGVQEYLEKQSMRRTPDLQKEEPSISSPPIGLIASALADFRG